MEKEYIELEAEECKIENDRSIDYTDDFKSRVLSEVNDWNTEDKILCGKLDLGEYLKQNAFKGIDPKIILECLDLHNLDYLEKLATRQIRLQALYQEYFEYYVTKAGETLKQKAIEEEIQKRKLLRKES